MAESNAWLREGKRWNAYLVHVVSERHYSTACRYLHYSVRLPWNRSLDDWEAAPPVHRKVRFIERIDNEAIPRMLEKEDDPTEIWPRGS